jgi:mannosyltransferase
MKKQNGFPNRLFYDVPGLRKYKWFWRIEPSISLTCTITYDPFLFMQRSNKRYGYVMALWELGTTAASLFRLVDEYKQSRRIVTTHLWNGILDSSWMPWPFRPVVKYVDRDHRNRKSDKWSMCEYWSNFEIADMDFIRSAAYRNFFDYFDRKGGFYFERVRILRLSLRWPCTALTVLVGRRSGPFPRGVSPA